MSDTQQKDSSFNSQRGQLDKQLSGSHSTLRQGRYKKYIGAMQVGPQKQPHMSLGRFSGESKLMGYAIELSPDPDPEGSVVAQIDTLGDDSDYEHVLRIANFGQNIITAKVWTL